MSTTGFKLCKLSRQGHDRQQALGELKQAMKCLSIYLTGAIAKARRQGDKDLLDSYLLISQAALALKGGERIKALSNDALHKKVKTV